LTPAGTAGLRLRADPRTPSAAQAAVDAANRRGRQDAVAVGDALFPGLDLGRLAQQTDDASLDASTDPIALPPWLDGVALLDRLLGQHELGGDRLKVMHEGDARTTDALLHHVHGDHPVDVAAAAAVAATFDAGNTVVLDAIDRRDRGVARLAETFGRIFACPININGYVSYRPRQAFGTHWDNHEVLILQLLGTKRWAVHRPLTLSPSRHLQDQHAGGEVLWDGLLTPGSFLSIPRGWAHTVESRHELSFHLTVTIPRLSVIDLLEWSVRRLDPAPASLRVRDATRPPSPDDVAAAEDLLRTATDPDALRRAVTIARANLAGPVPQSPRRLAAVLRRGDLASQRVRAPHPGGVHVADSKDGTTHLVFAGRAVACDDETVGRLAPLLDGRPHTAHEVAPAAGPDASPSGADLVAAALRVGLLDLADPDPWAGTA
jgi:hypothetical protein